jgi:O-antigen ligase
MTEANYKSLPADTRLLSLPAQQTQTATVPLLLTLIAVTVWLPEESSFYVGSFRMTVVRIFLLLIAPATIYRFAQLFSDPGYRFVWDDALMPILAIWMVVAPAVAESLDRGLIFGGTNALEFCIPYMAIRSFITQRGQALKFTKTLLYGLSVVGLLALLDWATNEWFIRNLASKITGYSKVGEGHAVTPLTADYFRFGLLRAASTIEHPILMATICATGVLLSNAYKGWLRWFFTISSLIGLVAALSSAPIGAFVLGVILIVYDKTFRQMPLRWVIFSLILLLAVVVVLIGSSNPWAFIFSKICFDPATAAYRVMEWEAYWPYVMSAPIFGLGTGQESLTEDLTSSVDSLWLRSAMLYGIPGMILTGAIFLGSASIRIDLGKPGHNLTQDEKKLALALDVIMWMNIFVATTVYYWGIILIYTAMLFGLRAHIGNLASLPQSDDIADDGS